MSGIHRAASLSMHRQWLFGLLFGASVLALAFRMTLGVSFTDESYYAAFVVGWLKTGVANGNDLMVHQTAALVVYPLVLLFHWISGGVNGLYLFLRYIYLATAVLASLSLYLAVRRLRGSLSASFAAIFALWFISFGLPAPSYDTLGMWCVLGALALFIYPLGHPDTRKFAGLPAAHWISSLSWAIAITAYPTMVMPMIGLVAMSMMLLREPGDRGHVTRYALVCVCFTVIAFVAVCVVLGPGHIRQMIIFTNSLNGISGGLQRKAHTAWELLKSHRPFTVACLAAAAVSGLSARRQWWIRIQPFDAILAAVFVGICVLSTAPTLFVYSHDIVLLMAIAGTGNVIRESFAEDSAGSDRALGVAYLTGLLAGLATMATAFNGILNFPVGGFTAACLSMASMSPRTGHDGSRPNASILPGNQIHFAIRTIASAWICGVMIWTAFSTYYGDDITVTRSYRMPEGVFAGMRASKDKVDFTGEVTAALATVGKPSEKLAVLRGDSVIYLMSAMTPDTVTSWGPIVGSGERASNMIDQFYLSPEHRPDVVVVDNRDAFWIPGLSEASRKLLLDYAPVRRIVTGAYDVSIYRKR